MSTPCQDGEETLDLQEVSDQAARDWCKLWQAPWEPSMGENETVLEDELQAWGQEEIEPIT
eukprot:3420987-Alexandrium_andersonii.AAC.1